MNTKYYPLAQRIIHWLIAFGILFMLFTVFLRSYWMNKEVMAEIIANKLSGMDTGISEDNAIKVAKGIRGNMWQWHVYIGYVLIGLFALRMFLFATIKNTLHHTGESSIKNTLRIWTYRLFYLLLAGVLLTGFLVENGPKSIHKTMEEVHEMSLYVILVFILLHFTGFLLAEFSDKKGIVSAMINGGNKENKAH
jgi:cytochrome b561